MHYFEVAPTQIVRLDSEVLTYAHSNILKQGHIVLIEVGRKQIPGVVIREVSKPTYTTKPILEIIESTPLPLPLIHLAKWMSGYYATHLALVLQTLLPRGLLKKRRQKNSLKLPSKGARIKIVLNTNQLAAVNTIDHALPGTLLLHGVTGSGKTAVYIESAKRTLESGKSVVVLLPEIALTTQVVNQFSAHFDNVILAHSKQTEAARHTAWRDILNSTEPCVVIGPRSALFMPLSSVGLIVIDEAHEPSFKQEQSPRYSALRAASVLSTQHKSKLVLGSATPSVSDYYVASTSHKPIVEMNFTARPSQPPLITVVDMKKRNYFKHHRFLSDILIDQLRQTLSDGKQVLIFHNRRGSTSMTLCEKCGWQAMCEKCFVPLTLHADAHKLRCHICGLTESVPTSCPICHSPSIIHRGVGTKLIESELAKIFPRATIGRFDGDSDADQTLDTRYKDLHDGSIDIIIGTQIVAKGLDLPHLRTVGVIQADTGLSLPDFSATERTFQLLAQVVGRVGRSNHETSVVVQSYQPSNFAIKDGLAQNFSEFYKKTIIERRRANFPPFTFLLKLTCVYKTEAAAIRNATSLAQTIRTYFPTEIEILGPTPAFYERQRDTYRWQLVLKSKKRSLLVDTLKYLPPTHWQFELDPISLL
ncbi:MAG: primosomal protein N' [Candidatus Nomurabacteria bacterium]|nr:MAG: primosomal protein N' [Candidatus Nomurabacteria bacterium]